VLSTSASELAAYARERLCVWRIGALWALITGLCFMLTPLPGLRATLVLALLAALLIAQFRLWDDLADRDHDHSVHPARVLVNTVFPWVYRLAVVIAALPIVGLIAMGAAPAIRLTAYAALCLATALIYSAGAGRTWRNQLVLLKYPVFVLLGLAEVSVKAMLAAVAVYLTVSVYDWKTTKRGIP
jgi:4-hydroxybenzoate polyprenyltransferase